MKLVNVRNLFLVMGLGAASSFALGVGDRAPSVALDEIQRDGSVVAAVNIVARTHGQNFVVLNFFQTLCGPCVAEQPEVSELGKSIESVATLRMVGLDRNAQRLKDYAQAHRDLIPGPLSLDTGRTATVAYGVTATPTWMVVDSSGKIIFKLEGQIDQSDIQQIKQLVGAN